MLFVRVKDNPGPYIIWPVAQPRGQDISKNCLDLRHTYLGS